MKKKITIITIISFAIICATVLACYILSSINSLNIKISNLESDKNQLTTQCEELQNSNSALLSSQNIQQNQLDELVNTLNNKQYQLNNLTIQLRNTRAQNDLNLYTIQQLNNTINELNQELTAYKQQGVISCVFKVDNAIFDTYLTFPNRHIEFNKTPTKTGYTFNCWEIAGEPIDFATYTTPSEDIVLNASFTENTGYVTVTKHYLDGTTKVLNHITDHNLWGENEDVADWIDSNGNLFYYNTFLSNYNYDNNVITYDNRKHQLPGNIELWQTKDYLFTGTRYINVSDTISSISQIVELTISKTLSTFIGAVKFDYKGSSINLTNIALHNESNTYYSDNITIDDDLTFHISFNPSTYEYYFIINWTNPYVITNGGIINYSIERNAVQHTTII